MRKLNWWLHHLAMRLRGDHGCHGEGYTRTGEGSGAEIIVSFGTILTFGEPLSPCDDCLDGMCTMNCSRPMKPGSERPNPWKTADSAPRDGTHILVCKGYYGPEWGFDQSPPMVVHYFADEDEPGFYLSSGLVQDSYNDHPIEFSHWRPLGAPPEN